MCVDRRDRLNAEEINEFSVGQTYIYTYVKKEPLG